MDYYYDNLESVLKQYKSELEKLNISPQQSDGYCGEVGCKGLMDDKIQLSHAMWLIELVLKSTKMTISEQYRHLGFIQAILWCTKLKSLNDFLKGD